VSSADAVGRIVDLAGTSFRCCHQFLHRLDLERRTGDEHERKHADHGDRRQVDQRVVGHLFLEEGHADQSPVGREQERVAITGRLGDQIVCDHARGPWLVVDDHRLAPQIAQVLGQNPGGDVDGAARGILQDQAHRTFRKSGCRLSLGETGKRGQHDQQTSADKGARARL